MAKRSVRISVQQRISANKLRLEQARLHEEREAAAIRALNQKSNEQPGEDVVAEMCASVIRVQRVG